MKSKALVVVVAALVAVGIGAGAFLAGMRIGGARAGVAGAIGQVGGPSGPGGQGGPGVPGQGFGRDMGGRGAFARGGFRSGRNGSAFVAGKVISKDKDSITVGLPQGGSKTVYVSRSTRFETISRGSAADASVGETVTAVGNTDSSGVMTARGVTVVKT